MNMSVVALQEVMFTCEAEGYNVSYEWRRHSSSGTIGRQSSLTITRATPPDEDQYYCIAMTEGGYVFSDNVTLTVDGEDSWCALFILNCYHILDTFSIVQHPKNSLVKKGDALTLTIRAEGPGSDQFIYQWKKMDGKLPSSRASGVDTTQLVITSVTTSDRGSYYCIVTNQWGKVNESMKAEVKVLCEFPIVVCMTWSDKYGLIAYLKLLRCMSC